jgi:hypothetical protein
VARLRFYDVRSFLFGFMLGFPVVITPKLIRCHNLCYRGRVALWSLGVLAVFLFVWVLASLSVGHRSLTLSILIFLYLGGNWAVRFWSLLFEKKWTAGLGTNRSEIGPETRGSLGSNE